MKYLIVSGIMAGTTFEGRMLNGRVLNLATTGQSYPECNCVCMGRLFTFEGIAAKVTDVTDTHELFQFYFDTIEITHADFITNVTEGLYIII